jgi:hypothetical protein
MHIILTYSPVLIWVYDVSINALHMYKLLTLFKTFISRLELMFLPILSQNPTDTVSTLHERMYNDTVRAKSRI